MDREGTEEEEASKDVNMLSGCSLHHRRSQSASDRNLDLLKHGVSRRRGKECNQSQFQNVMNVEKSRGIYGSVYHDSSDALIKASPKHRDSLENDIKQLQANLHQERSIRTMLERAIGRASSTLSPGHRHFSAQTRELIAEIELLEEEIAHREQHVLSLYRSIFEQCVSGPSSAQSSGMASPAHTSNKTRKHPSIISSAFCSSKKFPLQSFNILPSKKESEKCRVLPKPKTRHESLSSENLGIRAGTISADARKLSNAGRSCLARTLKDHLHQCPNKISEEMVQCMASIYCWMRSDSSEKTEKARSPFLSRSSTSVVHSRSSNRDEHVWSNKCTVEIASISADKNHLSNASQARSSYRLLVEQLERVDLSALETEAKLAFWINIYNALIMHSYLAYGIPHSALRRMALFHKAAYNVGGHIVTVNSIEHSLLCCRTPRFGRWFESILSTTMRKSSSEEKQLLESKFGLFDCQPLVFFALSTGASSDPTLRLYTAKNVIDELDKATKDFLQDNVVVKKSKRVYLPKIVDRYAKGASLGCDQLLTWISENVDDKLHDAIQKCLDSKNRKKASQIIEWLPYNTRFRYVFAKNLTEKTCWV